MKFPKWITDIYKPEELQKIKVEEILMAMNDVSIRKHWLFEVLDELKEVNLSIDRALDAREQYSFEELSAKRRALTWVLNQVLSSKNSVAMDRRHNHDAPDVAVNPSPE
jgi:hypothetical protein